MSLQSILNDEAICMIPKTKAMLKKRPSRTDGVLGDIMNSRKSLSEMTEKELKKFDCYLCKRLQYLDDLEKQLTLETKEI